MPERSAVETVAPPPTPAKVLCIGRLGIVTVLIWSVSCRAAEHLSVQTLDEALIRVRFASIPFTASQGRPAVAAAFNGTNGLFLVDTGWSISSIDDRAFGSLKTAS